MIDVHACFQFIDVQVQEPAGLITAKWIVPHDLPYLQGHFPEQPIVPAVAILDATNELLTQALGKPTELSAVKNAKFTKPLEPAQTVHIECKPLGENEWTVDWKIESGELVAKLHFAI
jgi:3-hydroxyacyl-[acyl-carrier-protein] dehydratase